MVAAALAESRYGAGKGVAHFCHADTGTGIGGALIVSGVNL
jgi:predicted NBD/HSP70 family sugar kinase